LNVFVVKILMFFILPHFMVFLVMFSRIFLP
jgi:hypothetical protein